MTMRRPLVLINGLMRALPTGDRVPSSEIGARVRRTAAQSIASGTTTAISFQSALYDSGGVWSSGTPTRLTVPVAGKYLIGGSVQWASSGLHSVLTFIRINGGGGIAATGGPYATYLNPQGVFNCAANDYLELIAFQDSGSAINIVFNAAVSPEFWIQRIGE